MNKQQSHQIKLLLENPNFDAVASFYQEYKDRIQNENVLGNNEFETLRNVYIKEGKLQGLKDFFDQLDRQASQ